MPVYPGALRLADFHVSLLSRGDAVLLTRASEERAKRIYQNPQLARVPLGVVPAFAEPDIHSLSQALRAVTED